MKKNATFNGTIVKFHDLGVRSMREAGRLTALGFVVRVPTRFGMLKASSEERNLRRR